MPRILDSSHRPTRVAEMGLRAAVDWCVSFRHPSNRPKDHREVNAGAWERERESWSESEKVTEAWRGRSDGLIELAHAHERPTWEAP